MAYHGFEIFSTEAMKTYFDWEMFKVFPSPPVAVYLGKSIELIAGVLLLIGLWTRLASLLMMIVMLYITFFVGNGQFWYMDQQPFLFVVLGWIFLTTGPGAFALDSKK